MDNPPLVFTGTRKQLRRMLSAFRIENRLLLFPSRFKNKVGPRRALLKDGGLTMPGLLIQLLIVLLIVGVVLWGLSQFPVDATIAKLIRVVVIVIVAIYCIYLLAGFLPTAGYPLRH